MRLIISDVLIVAGAIWFLQGIGALGGSFMSHNLLWAVVGGVVVLLAAQMQRRLIAGDSRRK